SAAAELLSPDQADYFQLLAGFRARLAGCMGVQLRRERERLGALERRLRLRHPGRRLQDQAQRLDELEARLRRGLRHTLHRARARLNELRGALLLHSPRAAVRQHGAAVLNLHRRLLQAARALLAQRRQRLAAQSQALHAVSPLNTLARGYSITLREDGSVLRDAGQAHPGDRLVTRLHGGRVFSTVDHSDRETDA